MQTETLRLGDERDQLDRRLDDIAAQIAAADDPEALQQLGSRVETQLSGVDYLVAEHGPDATVRLRGLSAGEYGRVEDRLARMRDEASGDRLPGAKRNIFAAGGLVSAPFLTASDSEFDARVEAVTQQPVGVAMWLEGRVNDLTTVEGNGYRSLSERIAANMEG